MRQINFGFLKDFKKEFGGSLLTGKRKSARPISTKHPLHLVLKSTGGSYFNPTNKQLEKLIRTQAKKYSITIYDYALNWSHIHVLLRVPSRKDYLAFIRHSRLWSWVIYQRRWGKILKGFSTFALLPGLCRGDGILKELLITKPWINWRLLGWSPEWIRAKSGVVILGDAIHGLRPISLADFWLYAIRSKVAPLS